MKTIELKRSRIATLMWDARYTDKWLKSFKTPKSTYALIWNPETETVEELWLANFAMSLHYTLVEIPGIRIYREDAEPLIRQLMPEYTANEFIARHTNHMSSEFSQDQLIDAVADNFPKALQNWYMVGIADAVSRYLPYINDWDSWQNGPKPPVEFVWEQ